MFSNFIYFLVALILYTTCNNPVVAENSFPPGYVLFFVVCMVFTGLCILTFKRIEKKISVKPGVDLDFYMDRAISRLSIFALFVFAADLYILNLRDLFSGIKLFQLFPTFEAVLFLGIFIFYLVIIWICAWRVQKKLFSVSVTKKSFVISNISFSLPAFLPWFLLSIVADIIQLLPFEQPKQFLATPGGEIVYVLVFLFAVAVFGPVLIQKMWGCTSLENGKNRQNIERLCAKAGIGYSDILVWNLFGGTMITAAVMGIIPKFRYILVTPALINNLLDEEIDSVISHEIGHVQKGHMYFYLFFFAGYIACIYSLFDPLLSLIYYSDFIFKIISFTGISHDTADSFIFSLTLIVLFLVYFRYVFGFFMRNFERQADTHVYSIMGDASYLITTFMKIAGFSRQSPEKPNWHHFSIVERINFLNRCQRDRSLIKKHDKKIKIMLLTYTLLISIVCFAGYYFNFGNGKTIINNFSAEKALQHKLLLDPGHSADIYTLMGDYYYDSGKFKQAVSAYENVLKIDSENIHALNNLAWLFATCTDTSMRDYKKALELSKKALSLERAPYILDTYAEACFLNHLYGKAIKASKEALLKATKRHDYYLKRLERFQ